jgi:2-isopropylmalate synthase
MTIQLYDTTLRDGTQHEGISLSVQDKLNITLKLDELGIDYIEGGWPGSNPKDAEYFERARHLPLKHARVAAFGSTCKPGADPADDPQVQVLLAAQTPTVTVVGKSWDLHVHHVLTTTLEENLRMIGDTLRYLKAQGREVFYDAEHFFDGFKANPDYALATIQAAQAGGADCVILCDTNGGTMPWELGDIFSRIRQALAGSPGGLPPFGIHTHDDAGCAVANTLEAVRHGAAQVQGTINGYGERVGNANLCSIIPNLKLKLGIECVTDAQLRRLTELSRFVSEVANMAPNPQLPYVGSAAFAHKGGIHVAAILKVEASYQHVDPARVGNEKRVLVSDLSGRGNIVYKVKQFGLDADKEQVAKVLQQIKELEHRGFYFEGAEGSVEVMLRRTDPGYEPPFELIDFTVVVEHRQGRGLFAEATVKVRVNGEVIHTAAEGNGPVNALDNALRKALLPMYPQLRDIQLTDYKVRILDGEAATAATTRVTITTSNSRQSWSTVGCSTNIIEASWQALVDGLEYVLLGQKVESLKASSQ